MGRIFPFKKSSSCFQDGKAPEKDFYTDHTLDCAKSRRQPAKKADIDFLDLMTERLTGKGTRHMG
ncbi:MAG: hypothetical protein CSA81_00780 [Acidobacteria bacterium]|nr:MAG: hypothetical protein CSA81_00780 [Acidobacteriota bacterium]